MSSKSSTSKVGMDVHAPALCWYQVNLLSCPYMNNRLKQSVDIKVHHPQIRSLGRLFLEYEFQTYFSSYTLARSIHAPVQTKSQALRYSVGDIISRVSRQLWLWEKPSVSQFTTLHRTRMRLHEMLLLPPPESFTTSMHLRVVGTIMGKVTALDNVSWSGRS